MTSETPINEFNDQIHLLLANLYDPAHVAAFAMASGISSREVHRAILDAVDALRPRRDPLTDDRNVRVYELLRTRYVDAMPIAEVQRRLTIGRSQYFREHRRAIGAIAAILRPRFAPTATPIAADHSPVMAAIGSAPHRPIPPVPTYDSEFIGRANDIELVARLLETSRLVTLVGAGGCGKTRLAIEIARQIQSESSVPIAFVDLAPLVDPTVVPMTLLIAIGGRDRTGMSVERTSADLIGARPFLIVLDNCEHVVEASAAIAESLLRACPGLRVLATSREPLRLTQELRWRVPSLDVPAANAVEIVDVAGSTAARLFVTRARRVDPDFSVREENAVAVGRICRQLDGIALAIELAAVRVASVGVNDIADRLDDRFRLLSHGHRDAPTRRQTLQALVDWSHDLLRESERTLLARISVFAGSFTLAAAEEVSCSLDVDVLTVLPSLVERSLVDVIRVDEELRYRLHETIRLYSAERLRERGETATIRDRHRAWCTGIADRFRLAFPSAREITAPDAPHLPVEATRDSLRAISRERANLLASLEWCVTSSANEVGLDLAWKLQNPMSFLGHGADTEGALISLLRTSENCDPATRASALTALARIVTFYRDDADAARALLDDALAWAQSAGGPFPLIVVYRDIGSDELARGNLAEALSAYEAVRRISAEHGFAAWHARILRYIAICYAHRGELDQSRALLDRSALESENAGDPQAVAEAQRLLADLAVLSGDLDEADRRYQSASGQFAAAGNMHWSETSVQIGLGVVSVERGGRGAVDALRDLLGRFSATSTERRLVPLMLGVFAGAVATVARDQQSARRAFLLASAARASIGRRLDALIPNTSMIDRWLRSARDLVSDSESARYEDEGALLTIDQAIAFALSEDGAEEQAGVFTRGQSGFAVPR